MIAEMQFILGHTFYNAYAAHVWSGKNELADKLSRLGEGASVPDECSGLVACAPVKRKLRFLPIRADLLDP